MRTAVVALTKEGARLGARIAGSLEADLYVKEGLQCRLPDGLTENRFFPFTDFQSMTEDVFHRYEALVCVMACGIVVRSLAPLLKDKTRDPAVVVVDEKGQFAISLLSGHIGGANRLAAVVARITGGTPVITTATDVQGLPAFDELAVKNHWVIEHIHRVKGVSSALLRGEPVGLFTRIPVQGPLPENLSPWREGDTYAAVVALTNARKLPELGENPLVLRPRNLVLGIGCRKGKSAHEIREAVTTFLESLDKSPLSLRCLASITLKANEPGLLALAAAHDIPFHTFTEEEIRRVEGQCARSPFVEKTTGVGAVAEACAILAGREGRLIAGKTVYAGITLALWEEETVFHMQPSHGRERDTIE